ncbi:hypothetical protein ACPV5Q_14120 [Vibrio astriarenae]
MNQVFIQQVCTYIKESLEEVCDASLLTELCQHWPALTTGLPGELTYKDLAPVNKFIKGQRSKVKKERYQRAFQQILLYLSNYGQHRLPENEHNVVTDKQTQWLERVSTQCARSQALAQWYQKEKHVFLESNEPPTHAFVVIAFALEVAPLSLAHLTEVLNKPELVTAISSNASAPPHPVSIVITHQRTMDQEEALRYRTHYALTPFLYRLLEKFEPQRLSKKALLADINHALRETSLSFRSPLDFKAVTECHWLRLHALPPFLLQDFAIPERHVTKHLTFDVRAQKPPRLVQGSFEDTWPHEKTLYSLMRTVSNLPALRKAVTSLPEPELNEHNVIPFYLYQYTLERIIDGGLMKKNLSHATIYRYTRLKIHLAQLPLTYEDALDEERLNQWAKHVYDQVPAGDTKDHMRKFFCFLSEQSLTEQLDMSLFTSPSRPPAVNAFCIGANAFRDVLNDLLTLPECSHTERLMCAVAAILSFHGMLRRGEILRLRYQDLIKSPKLNGQYFEIIVTETEEGKPKNGKNRRVSVCLPEDQAQLVHKLLEMKQGTLGNKPLIALDGETMPTRAHRYLMPISETLKVRFGQRTVFHHLRHSGARVMYEQLLRFAYKRLSHHIDETDDMSFLLNVDTVKIRFAYWLQNFEFSALNGSALFDEFCRQIGHSLYATTRFSYLHDMDWVPEILFGDERGYTHAELRFLFGLSPTSNDVARLIKNLDLSVYSQSLTERRRDPVRLSQNAVIKAMFKQRPSLLTPDYRESLTDLWEYSQTPERFYRHCEQHCVLDPQYHLSFQTLSALLKSSPTAWKKSIKSKAHIALECIDTSGLNQPKPHFILRASSQAQIQALAALLNHTELGAFSIKLTHHLNKNHRGAPKAYLRESQRLFGKLKLGHHLSSTRLRKGRSHIVLECYHPWITNEAGRQQALDEMKTLTLLLSTYR